MSRLHSSAFSPAPHPPLRVVRPTDDPEPPSANDPGPASISLRIAGWPAKIVGWRVDELPESGAPADAQMLFPGYVVALRFD